MGKKYIITISREFGSLGRPIAKKLSELLNIEFYDREIVDKTAENLNLPESVIKNSEESLKNKFFNMGYPLGNAAAEKQDIIFKEQTKIIRELADKDSCIIVGRLGDYIFQNEKNCFKVHIYAPYDDRYRNCIDILNMYPDDAKKTIQSVDKARKAYHLHYAGYAPGDPSHVDLSINSSVFGITGSAEALAALVNIRFKSYLS